MPDIDDQGRPEPPLTATETATLLGFLDFQRATLEWRCRGLDDDQLRATLPPSSLTLGGMLKHLAYVEDYWFTEVVAEQPTPEPWHSVDWTADGDWDWNSAAADPGAVLRTFWAERTAASRTHVARELETHGDAALDRIHPAWGGRGEVSLRWVLVHMIEEYARHNGHADFLRQSIDGETGE